MDDNDRVRNPERTRATMQLLYDRGGRETPVQAGDLWEAVAREYPLSPYEAMTTRAGGNPRAQQDWSWSSQDLADAGWLLRSPDGSGRWRITDAGVKALDAYPEPDEYFRELRRISSEVRMKFRDEIQENWGVMLCVDSGTCGKDLGYVYAPTPPRVLC